MKTILHTVSISKAPPHVYKHLTDATRLAGWWTNRVSADREVGGSVRFQFMDVFNPVMEILHLEEDSVVKWLCVDGHEPWADNRFSFVIEGRGDNSVLFFRQEYAHELDDEEYGTYNFNWGYYLHSLKKLCETGTGHPFSDTEEYVG